MRDLYIFDRDDNLLTILSNEIQDACKFWDAPFKEMVNKGATFEFTAQGNHEDSQYLKAENQVAFKDKDGNWRLFTIKEPEEIDGYDGPQIHIITEPGMLETVDDPIEDIRAYDTTAKDALQRITVNSRWKPRNVADLGINSTNFYYCSVKEGFEKIFGTWGGELLDVVEISENKITGRYIDLLTRRGQDIGKVWEIDKDIASIKHKTLSYPKTALYGRGASSQTEEGGYTRKATFADVVWSKANGDPADKPLGQEWVGDPNALANFGRQDLTLPKIKRTIASNITFDTNISSYVKGQIYKMTVTSSSRSVFDSANVKVGDYVTNGDISTKLGTITGINGYDLTVLCETNASDGTPAQWANEDIIREEIQRKHRFGFYEDDTEDPAILLANTWNELQRQNTQIENFELDVQLLGELVDYEHEKVRLGDTTRAVDRQFASPMIFQARVISFEYDVANDDETGKVEMGQYIDLLEYEERLEKIEQKLNDRSGIWDKVETISPEVNDGSFPDIKPDTPTNVAAYGLFSKVMLEWDYNPSVAINYIVYGSQVSGFVADDTTMLWKGKSSSFAHEADVNQQWYYRVAAVNTHGTLSDLSAQVTAQTVRILTDDILFGSITKDLLADLSVDAAKLADNSVTNSKLVDAAVGTAELANLAATTGKIADLAIATGKLADLAVTATQLAGSAVTSTKIANLAVGTAAINDLAVGSGKIAELAVLSGKIANLAVTNAQIADLTIATGKIADLAATTGKIADLAVTTGKIQNLAVGTAAITNLAVTNGKIGNLAVGTGQIADLAVTNAKIANLSIDNAKIADATITSAKIANLDASKITTGILTAITISGVTINGSTFISETSSNKTTISGGTITSQSKQLNTSTTLTDGKVSTLSGSNRTDLSGGYLFTSGPYTEEGTTTYNVNYPFPDRAAESFYHYASVGSNLVGSGRWLLLAKINNVEFDPNSSSERTSFSGIAFIQSNVGNTANNSAGPIKFNFGVRGGAIKPTLQWEGPALAGGSHPQFLVTYDPTLGEYLCWAWQPPYSGFANFLYQLPSGVGHFFPGGWWGNPVWNSADPGVGGDVQETRFGHDVRINSDGGSARVMKNSSVYTAHSDSSFNIYFGGSTIHAFRSDGTKYGGSILIDDMRLGMSPVDSPQFLIETIEFDIPLESAGIKVMLDSYFAKAINNKFAVFSNNGKIIEKGPDYFIIAGEGLADCRIIGERLGVEGAYWTDMEMLTDDSLYAEGGEVLDAT